MTTVALGLPRADRAQFVRTTKDLPISFATHEVDPGSLEKYLTLADAQCTDFIDQMGGLRKMAVSSGFRAVGMLLSQVPAAYGKHLHETGEVRDHLELAHTLVESFDTVVKPVADVDNRRNKTYETWFGLARSALGQEPAYMFKRSEEGTLKFLPRPEVFRLAQIEITRRELSRDLEVADPARKCMALRYVLPKVWSVMAVGCTFDYRYFGFDIKKISENS